MNNINLDLQSSVSWSKEEKDFTSKRRRKKKKNFTSTPSE